MALSKNKDVSFDRWVISFVKPSVNDSDPIIQYLDNIGMSTDNLSEAKLFTRVAAISTATQHKEYGKGKEGWNVILKRIVCDIDRYHLGETI